MAFETVKILVLNDDPEATPIEGVIVRIFDMTGTYFQTQSTTDSDGRVELTLLSPLSYQLRFFKEKVSLRQPVMINVSTVPGENIFIARGHVYRPPEAVNPRMCRCSGFFRNVDNSPAREHAIHVNTIFDPLLLDGNALLTERLMQRTNEAGYVEFDLVRNGQYTVTVEGFEDQLRVITVPDAPSANLPDLIFAVVDRVEFTPPGPWTLAQGERLAVTPQVWTSDGRVLPGLASEDVQWTSSDPSVAAVGYAGTYLELRAIAPGTAELRCTRSDQSIVRIPNTSVQGVPLAITVA
jgi:hypothetical protein